MPVKSVVATRPMSNATTARLELAATSSAERCR